MIKYTCMSLGISEKNNNQYRVRVNIMENKRFTKNDSGFICSNCGKMVEPLVYTSRNHCPFCLYSLHLDINPGDRESDCGGLMEPIAAQPDAKNGFIIIHRCKKCGAIRRNKAAYRAKVQPDDARLLIKLTANQYDEKKIIKHVDKYK